MAGANSPPCTELLAALNARGYHFVTPTPATHARVVARKQEAQTLRDIFGWSLPFREAVFDPHLLTLLRACAALEGCGDGSYRSAVRVSSCEGNLYAHSAYPTEAADAVFFGPDSYRFASFLRTAFTAFSPRQHIVDIGAGAGVGAITAGRASPPCAITLVDVNPRALSLARANIAHASHNHPALARHQWRYVEGEGLQPIADPIDCVIANPPYIMDAHKRIYRHGGDMLGGALSVRWAEEAAAQLTHGGLLLLYTGSAIVDGEDRLEGALRRALRDFDLSYRELDPDVFGEELERPEYAGVERIAAVGVIALKR